MNDGTRNIQVDSTLSAPYLLQISSRIIWKKTIVLVFINLIHEAVPRYGQCFNNLLMKIRVTKAINSDFLRTRTSELSVETISIFSLRHDRHHFDSFD